MGWASLALPSAPGLCICHPAISLSEVGFSWQIKTPKRVRLDVGHLMGGNGGVSDAARCLFSGHQSKPGSQLLEEPLQSHPAGSPPDPLLQRRSCASAGYEPRFLFTQTVWINTYPRSTLPVNSPCTRCRNISRHIQLTSLHWLCRESKHHMFKTDFAD